MSQIIPLLTAFGLGSIVTAFLSAWLSRRSQEAERSFREKQAAYVGLLEAYHLAVMGVNPDAGKEFGYWQMRCALVAPKPVRDAIASIPESNGSPENRTKALERLEAAMRADLGVTW